MFTTQSFVKRSPYLCVCLSIAHVVGVFGRSEGMYDMAHGMLSFFVLLSSFSHGGFMVPLILMNVYRSALAWQIAYEDAFWETTAWIR